MATINLGNGRRVSVGSYVAAWKLAKTLPRDTPVKAGSVPGQWWPGTVEDALRALNRGLDDRINRYIPGYGKGRKWSRDWFMAAWRTSRDVNMPRLIVRYVPPDLRDRLAHRLYTEED